MGPRDLVDGARRAWASPWMPYAFSLLLQCALAPWFIHDWDGFVFLRSVEQFLQGTTPYEIAQDAPSYIFLNIDWPSVNSWYAYPPGALLIMTPGVALMQALGLTSDAWMRVGLKLPLILGNLALAWTVGHAASRLGADARSRRRAELFILFNPFLIFIGAMWGMFDAWMMAFLILSATLLVDRRPLLAGLAFGAASLIKVFPLFVAPIFLIYALRVYPRRQDTALFVGAAAGSFTLVCLPFVLTAPAGFHQQVIGMHLARPLQGFALVRLPYLPRFTSAHFGWELWGAVPGWVGPALSLALLVPGMLLCYGAATGGRTGLRPLLEITLGAFLVVLAFGKVVNEQYFTMPVALLTVLVFAPGATSRAPRWALAAWTAGGLLAAGIIGFHFFTFLPREVALALLGMTPAEAIHGLGVNAERYLGLPARRFFVLSDVVSVLALLPALVMSAPLLGRTLRAGLAQLRRQAFAGRKPAVRAAAIATLVLLLVAPIGATATTLRAQGTSEASPMPLLGERIVGATYWVWWNNPSHRPDVADGNWERISLQPAEGYATSNGHQMEDDLLAMREAGIDFVAVSYHGYDDGRYEVLTRIARAHGIYFAPLIDASVLLGDDAHRATAPHPIRPMLRPTDATADALHALVLQALKVGGSEAYLRIDGALVVFVSDAHLVGPSWDPESKRVLAETVLARHGASFANVSGAWGIPVLSIDDVIARFPEDLAAYRGPGVIAEDWRAAVGERAAHMMDRVRAAAGVPLHIIVTQPAFTQEGDEGTPLPDLRLVDATFTYGATAAHLRPPPNATREQVLAAFEAQEGPVQTIIYAANDTPYRGAEVGMRIAPDEPLWGGDTFAWGWQRAAARNATMVLLQSWNQYFDGTSIEPTREYGTAAADATRVAATKFRST